MGANQSKGKGQKLGGPSSSSKQSTPQLQGGKARLGGGATKAEDAQKNADDPRAAAAEAAERRMKAVRCLER